MRSHGHSLLDKYERKIMQGNMCSDFSFRLIKTNPVDYDDCGIFRGILGFYMFLLLQRLEVKKDKQKQKVFNIFKNYYEITWCDLKCL